jgi:crossover junction endodeoxyribonuclease RuvC
VKVLGIDPGTAACGYGIVHESGGRLRAICHGWWRTSPQSRPESRLLTIFEGVQELIAQHAPDAVALEESFVGADARIALSVGQARGAVLVAASSAGVACTEYAPSRVKQTVCGYGRADKAQVGPDREDDPSRSERRAEAEPRSRRAPWRSATRSPRRCSAPQAAAFDARLSAIASSAAATASGERGATNLADVVPDSRRAARLRLRRWRPAHRLVAAAITAPAAAAATKRPIRP